MKGVLQRLGLAILCGIAGLLLNRWRLGSATPLLLGRVATLPVAIMFGPAYGALAAVLAALPATGGLTAAIVILPIEAAVVGGFARSGRSPLAGGVIVWSIVAATLLAAPSAYGVGYLRQTILPEKKQRYFTAYIDELQKKMVADGSIRVNESMMSQISSRLQ